MPTLHENRRIRLVLLGSLLAGCLGLATCGGNALRVEHPPPAPPAVDAGAVTATPLPSTQPEPASSTPQDFEAVPPLSASDSSAVPAPFETGSAETAPSEAGAEIAAEEFAADPSWEAMTPQERATRLQLEGLEFEAGRLAAEFSEIEAAEETAEEPTLLEELTETPIPDDFSLAENRQEILRRTQSDLPLVLNAQVIKLINYFSSGRGLKTYRATMGRAGAYTEMIERILEEEDVPRELFHLAQAESGFLPKARSWARATGMWQFVSYRGRQYGLRQDRYLEERYDPEKATRAAARHLKDLHIEFGDWYLALAAYNSGPERVRRAIRRSGSRDYWTLSERRLLPRETRNYIPIILAFTYLTKNQQLYSLGELDPAPPLRYDTVTTHSEISFQLIADLTDSTPATVQQLNPALLRSATPPFDYELRLPEGSGAEFREQIAYVPEDKRLSWRRPAIQGADSLASIARQYRVSEADIAQLNGLDGDDLAGGLRLTIPTQTKIELYGGGGRAGGSIEGGTGRYRIAHGDTLGTISRRLGVSVQQLMAWNGLSSTRIRAGRYLVVSPEGGSRTASTSTRGSSAAASAAALTGRYTVRRGDNLTEIAARYRVSVSDLKGWNGLRGSSIDAGQVLRVPGARSAASEAAPAGGQYRVRSGDNLATIANRFGVSVAELQAWNGLRGTRIRAGETLRVAAVSRPASQRAAAAPAAVQSNGAQSNGAQPIGAQSVGARASGAPTAAGQRYRIRRGDNLAEIAKRFQVSVEQLKVWNGLRGTRITAGEDLYVGPPSGAAAAKPAPIGVASAAPLPARPPAAGGKQQQYRVRRGDNLAEIARRFDVSIEDLKAWNGLSSSRITAGEDLTIRAGGGSSQAAQYRVRRGDTLDSIARRFGVSIDDLKTWNSLSNSRIHEGNYLTVQPEASENNGPQKLASAGGGS
jgi:membrane-bound lytic murein transglycosylase D